MPARSLCAAALFLALLLPAYWRAIRTPAVGAYRDDGTYLVTAKALAEGQGYRIASHPDRLYQTKYPPLYPFLLSLGWRVLPAFPANVIPLKGLNAFLLALWLWLAYVLLTRRMRVPAAAAVWLLLIIAASSLALDAVAFLLSEALFGVLLTAALLCAARLEDRPGDRWALAGVVLFGAAAFYTRTIGITLAGGAVAALLGRRRVREALAVGLVSGALMAPWWIWQRIHADSFTTAPQRYYTADNYRDWNTLQGRSAAAGPATVIPANLGYVLYFPVAFFQLGGPLQRFIWLALAGALTLWAFVARGAAARPPDAALALLALYLAVILNWSWVPYRFLLPLAPLLAGWLYLGTPPRLRRALAVLALGLSIASLWFYWNKTARSTRWAGMARAAEWVSRNTQPGDVIGATYDGALFLYSGRPAVNIYAVEPMVWYSGASQPLERKVRDAEITLRDWRVDYVLESGLETYCDPDYPALAAALQQRGRLRRIASLSPGLTLYRVFR